ncbi:hypothetical protein BK004_03320 [bacterium CG10_46_32]|nr:MAG: hypothetical protein BK004_03320 [bacterium CG10_46_32]PIR55956.1 MAG: hypothetical protein COU73_03350 [Parcubacteria group bacterium CG10_big_fil_rev_8_21_14_0_10_46_32]
MNYTKLVACLFGAVLLGAACRPGNVTGEADGGVWVTSTSGEEWAQQAIIYEDKISKKTIGDLNVKKFIFSPADPRKIFLISSKSGLWFSWNQGYLWDLILPNNGVSDLAIHPNNPKLLYAAVGSSVAVSTDEGVHWRSTYTSDSTSTLITTLAINPNTPNTVYAATSNGDILISEDSGVSWRVHTALGSGTILEKMQFHPSRPSTLYAIAQGKGLMRSEDAGENWEFFADSFSSFSGTNDPRDFALIPSGIVYASKYGLLRSLNQGKDWTSLPLISGPRDANIYALAVNPQNPLEIFYGTTSTLYHSLDGGFNWIPRPLPSTRRASALVFYPEDQKLLFMGVSLSRN